jgi:Zn-dependent protease
MGGPYLADRDVVHVPAAIRPHVPLAVGRGGLVPGLVLGALFAAFAARNGLPVAVAAALGGLGGTASLLFHELGHVRAAERLDGIRGATVSLVWLGAATRLEGSYASGSEQARVAIAGPRASFGLALALVGVAVTPLPVELKVLVLALALLNVALGVLNLLPAYPLDGYKVVVGLLWWLTGSQDRARRIVRRVAFGWLALELAGGVLLLAERPVAGLVVAAVAACVYAQKRVLPRRRG